MDKLEILIASPCADQVAAELTQDLCSIAEAKSKVLSTRGVEMLAVVTVTLEMVKMAAYALELAHIVMLRHAAAQKGGGPTKVTIEVGGRRLVLQNPDEQTLSRFFRELRGRASK
jgi:hypothetical protein